MANFIYRKIREAAWSGSVDLAGDTFKAALLMSNTTAEADVGAEFVDDVATLDELDATGYSRVTLSGLSLAEDVAADLFRWLASAIDFGSPSPDASRQVVAVLIYKHFTDDTDSPVVAYFDLVSSSPIFPFTVNGGQILVTPAAEGIFTV